MISKKTFYILSAFTFLIFVFAVSTAQAATLILSPSSGTVTAGQNISVDIMLNTEGAAIDGVDINSLHYNQTILEVQDADSSATGVQITAGTLLSQTLTNIVNTANGTIDFSQVTSGGGTYNSAGKLATITFKGLAAGTSAVTFDFTLGSTTDTNVAGSGVDKLTSVGNGSFTVASPADTTPPIISGITASGITSTEATITWNTNENSDTQIDYGTTTAYGSSTTLNTSSITTHTQTLTELNSSTLYHYRVKSKDTAGNLATSSDFTFTTISSADTTPPSTPINFTASVVSSSQINLTWSASVDNIAVSGYRILRNSAQIATAITTTAYSDTSLAAATNYSYTVQAYDAANNLSAQSTPSNATTHNATTQTVPPSGGGGGGGGGGGFYVAPTIFVATTAPTVIAGCDGRTTGFSASTGQSCAGNTGNVATVTPYYNFGSTTLRRGSRGEAVKELQRFLNQVLNLGLVVDGKLGPKTIAVIKKWQRDNGLVADGLVGVKTKAKMNATVLE